MNSYAGCPQVIRDFLFYMQTIKGRSERTVEGYFIDLRTFFRFINRYKHLQPDSIPFQEIPIENIDIGVIQDITLSDIYEFLHFVSSERQNNAKTRARKVSSIKAFFHYLKSKVNLLDSDPTAELEMPSLRKSLPKYLTLEQCLELLNNVEGEFRERDYCIITLFLNCGMRLSELVGINLNSFKDNTVRLLGKGNKERIVYLNDACLKAVEDYKTYRAQHPVAPADRNAFFLNRRGKRLGARRVEQIVEEHLKRAGLDQYGFSVHKLRHTAATIMYQYGHTDIRVLQEILGHANLGTTEIYTHISDRQMEQAAENNPLAKLHPPSSRGNKKKNREE